MSNAVEAEDPVISHAALTILSHVPNTSAKFLPSAQNTRLVMPYAEGREGVL